MVHAINFFGLYTFAIQVSGNWISRTGDEVVKFKLKQLKGLILAQNERWRRGLGMQVAR